MTGGSDGIAEAEAIVRAHHLKIDRGMISGVNDEQWSDELSDAVQFLIEEWDYAIA